MSFWILYISNIFCRDLKPANVLLGDKGHIMITYFCQMNNVDKLLDEWAVENMYTAPGKDIYLIVILYTSISVPPSSLLWVVTFY